MTIIFWGKFLILFSTVNLNLWHKLSQFIHRYSKFRFWNVDLGLCILPSFLQFVKKMENLDFWIAAVSLPKFSQFIKEFQNLDSRSVLAFIFCQMMRIVFQHDMWRRIGEANLWLNSQFSKTSVYIIMQVTILRQFKSCKYCFQTWMRV